MEEPKESLRTSQKYNQQQRILGSTRKTHASKDKPQAE